MDIWQMRYFIQMYNDKSISKAAKNLYISQQGLSKTIKNIEDEFQISLFERTPAGIQPTKFGEILLEKSKKILKEYDEMVNVLNHQVNLKNKTLSIGIINMLYTDLLKNIMNQFQEENPDIIFEFYELGYYSCEKYLDDNLIDICFTIRPESLNTFEYIPVSRYKLIILANKKNPICQTSEVNIKELRYEKFITLPSDSKIREIVNHFCLNAGFSPNIIITTFQLDYIIELIELNKGIAILPEYSSVKALEMSKNISVIQLDDLNLKVEVGFIINKYKNTNHVAESLIAYFNKALNSNNL